MSLADIPAGSRVLIDANVLIRDLKDLLAGELTVLPVEAGDFLKALELQHQHGLLTNDSLNLAAMTRDGITLIATADPQFDAVAGLTVFKADDLP